MSSQEDVMALFFVFQLSWPVWGINERAVLKPHVQIVDEGHGEVNFQVHITISTPLHAERSLKDSYGHGHDVVNGAPAAAYLSL